MRIRANFMIGIACLLAVLGEKGYSQPTNGLADAFSVIDALGRAVQFSQPPQRVVVVGKASFTIANAVALFPGARHRLVAFSGGIASRQGAGDFLSLVMPDGSAIALQGGDAGVEQIAATKPDVVLLKSSSVRLGDVLSRLGIPVVYLDFETTAQYARDLAVLGQVLGDVDRAGFLISNYKDLLADVRGRVASIPAVGQPRTLLLQYSERGGVIAFSVPPPEWIQTELVELAGGIPVWKDAIRRGGWTVVNLEQIAAWDPDAVFVVNYTASSTQSVADIMADTKWQALRATRENKIFAFPGDFYSWDQPDTRWGLGLLWLATRLHPDRFREIDLPAEIVRFYELYGLDTATVQSRVMPLIRENIVHVDE